MPITHVFFDLDRTLWDFERNNKDTFQTLFAHFDLQGLCNCTFDTFYAHYKIVNSLLWEAYRNGSISKEVLMTKRFSLTLEHFNCNHQLSMRDISDFYISASIAQKHLLPHAMELLEYLQSKSYRMSIITNGFKEVQYKKMNDTNISHFFDHIFISEEVGCMKPQKAIFNFAMEKASVNAKECVMIGDDYEVDIVGAKAVGIETIFCNFTNKVIGKDLAKPSYEVYSLVEISNIL